MRFVKRDVKEEIARRIPRPHGYQLTGEERRLAAFFTRTYTRIVNPSLAELDPALRPQITSRAALATAWRAFERVLDDEDQTGRCRGRKI